MSNGKMSEAIRALMFAVIAALIFWVGSSVQDQGKSIVRLEVKVTSLERNLNKIATELLAIRLQNRTVGVSDN